jgi:hypothetical protein
MADQRDEGFLGRWARRKERAARRPAARGGPEAGEAEAPEPARAPDDPSAEISEAERRELVDSLPEPEQLGPEDDYSQFLQKGVPDDLRQRALRRLWRSNPVFANLDGLNDYDLDYTDAATVVENLKSAYQVGRGMIGREEREAEAAAAEKAAAEEDGESAAGSAEDGDTAVESAAPEGDPANAETAAAVVEPDPDGVGETDGPAGRARYRPDPDGRARVKGRAARRRWGGA